MLIHTGTPSNRRGVKIQLALLAAIVLFTGILLSDFSWPTQEPTYERRSVTDWMMRMEPGSPTLNEGLSVIGTNAIPYLIKALATKESFHNKCLRLYLGRILPDALTQRLSFGSTWSAVGRIRACAATALAAFRGRAEPARAALYAVLEDEHPAVRDSAFRALDNLVLSKDSIPVLVNLWQRQRIARLSIIDRLGRLPALDPPTLTPILVQGLDGDAELIHRAAWWLGFRPTLVTPEANQKLSACSPMRTDQCESTQRWSCGS